MSKIDDTFADDKRVGAALAQAAREAWSRHQQLGHPVAEWSEDGVVWSDPSRFTDPAAKTASGAEPHIAELAQDLAALPPDKLLLAAAYIRQLRDS